MSSGDILHIHIQRKLSVIEENEINDIMPYSIYSHISFREDTVEKFICTADEVKTVSRICRQISKKEFIALA